MLTTNFNIWTIKLLSFWTFSGPLEQIKLELKKEGIEITRTPFGFAGVLKDYVKDPFMFNLDSLAEQTQIQLDFSSIFPVWVNYLFLFYLLFLIGLMGMIFNYKNYLVTMFCIEIMYLGITVCFVIVSISTADPKGQIYAILLLVLAAAESAIGLGILIVLYRFGSSIDFQDYQQLKG